MIPIHRLSQCASDWYTFKALQLNMCFLFLNKDQIILKKTLPALNVCISTIKIEVHI